jgi:hypothetical protein
VRRIKLVVGVGVVMAAMLALSAGPAMADEWDGHWNEWDDHHGFNETLWLAEGTAAYDQWCSPSLPAGIWIPGCIFSDPIEKHHFLDEAVFVIDDIDVDFEDDIDFKDLEFDEDCDCDDDDDDVHFRKDGKRFHDDVEIEFG